MASACYSATAGFPVTERYGLTAQLQRAAVSVAANIAEGAGRKSDREFIRFIRIARGSANEAETLLILAERLGYLSAPASGDLQQGFTAVKRQLAGLERKLRLATDN